MTSTPIYSMDIMQIAANMPAADRLQTPDASALKTAKICGSKIEVDINVENGNIIAYGQKLNSCVLGQAAASVVAQNIVGTSAEEMRILRDQMEQMLKKNGEAPAGKWAQLRYLLPVRDFSPRHASTMLVFEAVVDCLDMIEGNDSKAVKK